MTRQLSETNIPGLKLKARGKVRDIYDLGDELLIVTTDRISAFDVVIPTPIPGKGEVLTQMAKFWFKRTENIIPNHISKNPLGNYVADSELCKSIESRSMVVKKAVPLPVEAIVRGYLSGSGLKEYQNSQTVCGIKLPAGLIDSSKLPETIFTPSTKADVGLHDENISFEKMADLVGKNIAEKVRDISIRVYDDSVKYAMKRGIIIADTKFEFGILDDELIIIDEMLTPDSSRFWPAASYRAGISQPSFDKQFVRDWLTNSGWDKKPPAPELPADVVAKTAEKYREALKLLTK
ncbi:MAG TPA: phosphoribosylaminoimidazolesuccinocarboxamide synthase [bacterium]|jgi:phosphoribosylaminoimidazole-succinocarboxamide synthase|nr:phosphoribosylaminoimidazolesuccinocarboxamide synthase [Myxococcales bacterium]OQA62328.1 MAG: Phosphoribosylaminoimidazole-succinocarboxamide synthase [bacterium ADurb.Bin270]HPW45937.1 phosphoribosylaminoimidazolesuccinocarboxamide synthase [bacterium]HQC50434.1 phosphoribosylaminoimidazolesuccinocarboxamide synthase [bacterium]HQG12976.1 phosphoribosylaminoimidazolesuccinocarboxamide synthase [bacterium]